MTDQDIEALKLEYFYTVAKLAGIERELGGNVPSGAICPHAAQWCPFWTVTNPATLEALNASNTRQDDGGDVSPMGNSGYHGTQNVT